MDIQPIDTARGAEAWRIINAIPGPTSLTAADVAASLARTDWTPPQPDPLADAAKELFDDWIHEPLTDGLVLANRAIRLGVAMERERVERILRVPGLSVVRAIVERGDHWKEAKA